MTLDGMTVGSDRTLSFTVGVTDAVEVHSVALTYRTVFELAADAITVCRNTSVYTFV